jgi:hypothetical protein
LLLSSWSFCSFVFQSLGDFHSPVLGSSQKLLHAFLTTTLTTRIFFFA